jgi:hypothetical protein
MFWSGTHGTVVVPCAFPYLREGVDVIKNLSWRMTRIFVDAYD